MANKIDHLLIRWQKTRDQAKAQGAMERPLSAGIGLKQFTLPAEKPIRHNLRDETAYQAIGRCT